MTTRTLILVAAFAFSLPAFAQQVRFTGHTTANETLLVDTLRMVALLGPGRFSCPTVEAVDAQVLPESFSPGGNENPEGTSPTTYERWEATFCGEVVPILIAFWPAEQEGMMFRIGFPFPEAKRVP